jgi:hypothetical protein
MERTGRRAAHSFTYFVYAVFSQSFDQFTWGEYLEAVTERFDRSPFTIDVGPREHFKSTRLYARIMFNIWRARYGDPGGEGHYFSYNVDMSRYHLEKVKDLIERNPYFDGVVDLKVRADSNISYAWPKLNGKKKELGPKVTFTPSSLLSFKRGIHARWIYIDDPLRDPENKMVPTIIHKINRIILVEVMQMVNEGGECRVVGTPQTWADFYFLPEVAEQFDVAIVKAYVDEAKQIVLWPEYWSWERLKRREALIKRMRFSQEFLATPAYEATSYINADALEACIDPDLESLKTGPIYEFYKGKYVVGGHDIGKKRHPAHCAIYYRYKVEDNAKGETIAYYKQIVSKWFDGIDYKDQVDWLNEAIDCFNISLLRYDNTRGEFEGFAEAGKLHRNLVPVVFGNRNQNGLASSFDAKINERQVIMVNDTRQKEQILAVDGNLKAMETPEGHGDSFWSNVLALGEEKRKEPRIRSLSNGTA